MTTARPASTRRLHPDALAAVARTRAEGMHFWGRMLGLGLSPTSDGTPLLQATGGTDATVVATLVDISLGQAIRAELGTANRLATVSLSLQHVRIGHGPITCGGRLVWIDPDGRRALAKAFAQDARGSLVATAQAWMAVVPLDPASTIVPMPWERPPTVVGALGPGDLTPTELAAATTATRALERAATSGRPVAEELLGLRWTERGDQVVGVAPNGPHLGNRVGNVQGGALYGLAAVAAGRLVGADQRLADGAIQYLRPGTGEQLRVSATLVRRGRSVSFVDTLVEADDVAVASAHFTFMAG